MSNLKTWEDEVIFEPGEAEVGGKDISSVEPSENDGMSHVNFQDGTSQDMDSNTEVKLNE